MRVLTDHIVPGKAACNKVMATGEPGVGGACHDYQIIDVSHEKADGGLLMAELHFQNGPIAEVGVNGIQNEDLLALLIDRLKGFQGGLYKCRENALALTKLEEALMWLKKRTGARIERQVEGTHEI